MPYILVGIFGIFLTGLFASVNIPSQKNLVQTEASAIAGNMMVYCQYVSTYAQANTTITGTVADSALALPAWFNRNSLITNYVANGKGYVYFAQGNQADMAYKLVKMGNQSINAGIKKNGILVNPMSLTNYVLPLPLPSAIPDGSVVIAP